MARPSRFGARLWLAPAGVSAETGPLGGGRAGWDRSREVGMMSRDVLREYVRGSLWVLAALAAGAALASVSVGSRSRGRCLLELLRPVP